MDTDWGNEESRIKNEEKAASGRKPAFSNQSQEKSGARNSKTDRQKFFDRMDFL